MRRPTLTALVVVVGLVLLTDLLVVNGALAGLAGLVVDAVILVAAGVALAAVGSLGARRIGDLWRRRGDPVGAVLVVVGMAAMLVAGLRPTTVSFTDDGTVTLINQTLLESLGYSRDDVAGASI